MPYLITLANIIKRKVLLIFLIGFLCAALCGLEKQYFTNYTIEIGNYRISQVLKLTDVNINSSKEQPFAYDRLITDKNFLMYFFDDVNDLNMTELEPNWEKYDGNQKVKWFQDHFVITNLNQGLYLVSLDLDKETIHKSTLKLNLGEDLLNTYIDYSKKKVDQFYPGIEFSIKEQRIFKPEKKQLNKSKIVVKYALLGFVFGSILATSVLLIINVKKSKKNGR